MNSYAATMLGRNPISTGQARQRTALMVNTCYGGCVIGLLALVGWREEPERSELRIGNFLGVLILIPT
jgi:hypothetical protein